eukprot:8558523-Pyramimonas_sp.AAC.1
MGDEPPFFATLFNASCSSSHYVDIVARRRALQAPAHWASPVPSAVLREWRWSSWTTRST